MSIRPSRMSASIRVVRIKIPPTFTLLCYAVLCRPEFPRDRNGIVAPSFTTSAYTELFNGPLSLLTLTFFSFLRSRPDYKDLIFDEASVLTRIDELCSGLSATIAKKMLSFFSL